MARLGANRIHVVSSHAVGSGMGLEPCASPSVIKPALDLQGDFRKNECIASNAFNRRKTLATITIRNLKETIKTRLRVRAASHNRSMEEEARVILREALGKEDEEGDLGSLIHERFKAAGGIDLPLPERRERPRRMDGSE